MVREGSEPERLSRVQICIQGAYLAPNPYESHRYDQRLLGQPALPIRDTESDEDTVDNSDIKQGEEDEKAADDMTGLDDSDINE